MNTLRTGTTTVIGCPGGGAEVSSFCAMWMATCRAVGTFGAMEASPSVQALMEMRTADPWCRSRNSIGSASSAIAYPLDLEGSLLRMQQVQIRSQASLVCRVTAARVALVQTDQGAFQEGPKGAVERAPLVGLCHGLSRVVALAVGGHRVQIESVGDLGKVFGVTPRRVGCGASGVPGRGCQCSSSPEIGARVLHAIQPFRASVGDSCFVVRERSRKVADRSSCESHLKTSFSCRCRCTIIGCQ